jgi:uncharacterized glyoxalase superfamily protein PhnB
MLSREAWETSGDLGELLAVGAELKMMPAPDFRERLKAELISAAVTAAEGQSTMATATKTHWLREGMHSITPYLIVDGAAKLKEFMEKAFGAEERGVFPSPDGKYMHAAVRIGDSMVEFADSTEKYSPRPAALHIYVEDADATYQKAVEAGATPKYAPRDQPYGDREGSIQDIGGNLWYIATHKEGGHVPSGLRTITPYLHPKGTGALIEFLKNAFDAELVDQYANDEGVVLHAKVRIGDSMIEMGEAHGEWQPMPTGLHLYVPDCDATYRQAIAAGAISERTPEDAFYGDRVAGVIDPAGNSWFLATAIREMPGSGT